MITTWSSFFFCLLHSHLFALDPRGRDGFSYSRQLFPWGLTPIASYLLSDLSLSNPLSCVPTRLLPSANKMAPMKPEALYIFLRLIDLIVFIYLFIGHTVWLAGS